MEGPPDPHTPTRPDTYDVIIVGAGPAGSAAAIHLVRRGYRVLLLEKRTLPAPKLCGEFLSPETNAAFEALGVGAAVHAAGAHPITQARMTVPGGAVFEGALPGTALGLSRYRLDSLLFEHARSCGAEVCDGCAVEEIEGGLDEGFTVKAGGETFRGRAVFGAYGKRSTLDRKLDRAFLNEHTPYVAFKAHYAGAPLPAGIEVHAFPGGYCGVSCVEDGHVNVCWIGRTQHLKDAGGAPEAMIERAQADNAALAARLRPLERVADGFEAVSQISLARKPLFERGVCMIGDTAGMVAPLCGDGMAMALRSATLAAAPAVDFLEGRCSAGGFRARYASAWGEVFSTRMRLGRWLHRAALRPGAAALAVRTCSLLPDLGRWLIYKTRG